MVASLKPITLLSIVVIFLFEAKSLKYCFVKAQFDHFLCIENEKQALLSFKRGLVDPCGKLSSWIARNKECCKWDGIVCDNKTGHVKELHLGGGQFKGKISPSLLELEHLNHLDLSHNDFLGTQIPSFIGSLSKLKYLAFVGSRFEGLVPHQLGNLSSLLHLDLGGYITLRAQNVHWLSRLSSLEYLGMYDVNLSEASDHWLQAINKLPSLTELHFWSCELSHIHNLSHVNFTSLTTLDLSFNHFYSAIPNWVFSLTNLVSLQLTRSEFVGPLPNGSWNLTSITSLDVSNNNLVGFIPSAIENLTSIVSLGLSWNILEGKIPISMGNLCILEEIGLTSNKFGGKVSEAFGSLSGCLSKSLKSLSIGKNSFTGPISDNIGDFKNLVHLSLENNSIYGPLPASLGKLLSLESLDVSNNRLTGSLPESLGSLSNLQKLYISENFLSGTVSEVHFANLTNLIELDGSGNSLTLRASPHWNPPFHLDIIRLRSWNLGPRFPMWVKSQTNFTVIDLSNTGISDSIPNWFWNLSFNFLNMNLSHNQIHGEVPNIINVTGRSTIYLGSNNLKGPLPQISSTLRALDLSNNFFSGDISRLLCHPMGRKNRLTILRLGRNLLSGKIPNCWSHWQSLEVIEFGSNNLSGKIPNSIGSLHSLKSLHLRNNSLSGEIPFSLRNYTMLRVLDFGLNKITGSIPKWIGNGLPNLVVLSLRSNKLRGEIPVELCGLTKLQILDIADNNLFGTIPSCFSNLEAMATKPESREPIYINPFSFAEFLENVFVVTKGREEQYNTILPLLTSLDLSQNNLSGDIPEQLTSLQGLISLNFSRNDLRGTIPDEIGDMAWIESLDLSSNQLSGRIPPSMSRLNSLSYLNVSYNNLTGEIPLSTQLQSLKASGFMGNPLLCGPPLPKKCGQDDNTTSVNTENGGEDEEYCFRLGIAMGFGVGFLGVVSPLVFFRFWREAYYWFIQEYIWYKILDCIIKVKRMGGN